MYTWIWRQLPGPLALRLVQVLVLLAAVGAVLFLVVFPRVEASLPYSDVTVSQDGPTPSPAPSR